LLVIIEPSDVMREERNGAGTTTNVASGAPMPTQQIVRRCFWPTISRLLEAVRPRHEFLSTDAYFVSIDHSQSTGEVDILHQQQSTTKDVSDRLLGWWMNLQADDSFCLIGRETHEVCEVRVERKKYAVLCDCEAQYLFVEAS
jgi:hypothetical protein